MNNPYIKYLKYLLKHKYYVTRECFKYGLYWQGIIHDWQKFLPSCFIAYARFFNIDHKIYKEEFNKAWLQHIHFSPHHWQHWLLQKDSGKLTVLDMPDKYVIEMVCDWIGAGKAIHGTDDIKQWYDENVQNIKMSSYTRVRVEKFLYDIVLKGKNNG